MLELIDSEKQMVIEKERNLMSKLQLSALSIDVTGLSLSTGWDYPHLL